MDDEAKSLVEKKKNLAFHYYDNFQKHFADGRLPKSSEFLWGALCSLLYAVGWIYGKQLNKHAAMKVFSTDLSNALNDPDIHNGFMAGEELHANFYHDFLDSKEKIEIKRKIVDSAMKKLMDIIDEKTKEDDFS